MNYKAILASMFFCLSVGLSIGQDEGENVFRNIRYMPAYAGCETEEGDMVNHCTQMKINDFINENCTYPEEARDNNISGRVILDFEVDEKGDVVNVVATSSTNDLLKVEAIRVISMLPKFTPGEKDGESVRVVMTIPVFFRL